MLFCGHWKGVFEICHLMNTCHQIGLSGD